MKERESKGKSSLNIGTIRIYSIILGRVKNRFIELQIREETAE